MIRQAIRAFLLSDTTLEAQVHGRIFADFAPECNDFPHVTMTRVSMQFWRHLAGDTEDDVVRLQIDVWALKRSDAVSIAKLIRNSRGGVAGGKKLRNFAGTITCDAGTFTVKSCYFDDENDDLDPPAHSDEVGIKRVMMSLVVCYAE